MSADTIYYECLECGERGQSDFEPLICDYCERAEYADSENIREISPPPENGARIYCTDCNFETTVSESDAKFPQQLVEARQMLHSSTGHTTRVEHRPIDFESAEKMRSGVCPQLDNEDELQAWLKSHFEENGWTAIREVKPHGSDYSADLLVNHDRYGWIGIECKYFDHDGGSKIAKAHHQIVTKYRGEKFIKNNRVNLWAICPYFKGIGATSQYYRNQQELRQKLLREMFCAHGMGIIKLNRYSLLIDFAYSQSGSKIPVSERSDYHSHEKVDIENIRDIVSKKMDRLNY